MQRPRLPRSTGTPLRDTEAVQVETEVTIGQHTGTRPVHESHRLRVLETVRVEPSLGWTGHLTYLLHLVKGDPDSCEHSGLRKRLYGPLPWSGLNSKCLPGRRRADTLKPGEREGKTRRRRSETRGPLLENLFPLNLTSGIIDRPKPVPTLPPSPSCPKFLPVSVHRLLLRGTEND